MHTSMANDDLPLKVAVHRNVQCLGNEASFGRFLVIIDCSVYAAECRVSERVPSAGIREWSNILNTADCHG
jgi:hypothetical protein